MRRPGDIAGALRTRLRQPAGRRRLVIDALLALGACATLALYLTHRPLPASERQCVDAYVVPAASEIGSALYMRACKGLFGQSPAERAWADCVLRDGRSVTNRIVAGVLARKCHEEAAGAAQP